MSQIWRIGIGYDIHAAQQERALYLGGVEVPADFGLGGHTDGDVVIHALIDALFGAAGLRDIGEHFPDTDPAWRGLRSAVLLKRAVELVGGEGWRIGNVDLTIVAEQPKLSAWKEAIRDSLAGLLAAESSSISVKAKTNEGCGALGRGEAIACHAAVLLFKGAD